jgi:hypothetical protein
MSNCIICLVDFEKNKKFKCCNPECAEAICLECVQRYIEISSQENSIPTCPRDQCPGIFDEKTLPESLVPMFQTLLYNHLFLTKKGEISDFKKSQAIVEILREEKKKFIVESMPVAIKFVAGLVFGARLRKVTTIQKGRTNNRVSRTCINLVCNGFLDDNFKCAKCGVVFCKDCEEQKSDDHVCKSENVESLTLLNSMTKCPGCKTHIEKSDGCMAMTCAVCKTNFWYNTGEKGAHGNHGQYKHVIIKDSKLTIQYKDKIPAEYIKYISDLERFVVTTDIVKNNDALDRLILRESKNLELISSTYSKMVRDEISYRIFAKKLATIEKILKFSDPDYEEQLKKVFAEDRKIIVSKIIINDGKTIIIEDTPSNVFDNIVEAINKMKVSSIEIRKAIETNHGIYNSFHWSYDS